MAVYYLGNADLRIRKVIAKIRSVSDDENYVPKLSQEIPAIAVYIDIKPYPLDDKLF